jgi:hypothetical protein
LTAINAFPFFMRLLFFVALFVFFITLIHLLFWICSAHLLHRHPNVSENPWGCHLSGGSPFLMVSFEPIHLKLERSIVEIAPWAPTLLTSFTVQTCDHVRSMRLAGAEALPTAGRIC